MLDVVLYGSEYDDFLTTCFDRTLLRVGGHCDGISKLF